MAQSISICTENCINTVILFLYTFHTIWVLFTQCGYFYIECSADQWIATATWTRDSAIHDVIVFNFFFLRTAKPPPQTPLPVNNFDIQTIKSSYLILLTLRESSPHMMWATTSVSAVPVPRLCKEYTISERECLCSSGYALKCIVPILFENYTRCE